MNKEYPVSTGWKVFMYITAIGMIAGSFYVCTTANAAEKTRLTWVAALCVMIGVYTVYYTVRKKVIITPNSIIHQSLFTRIELFNTDIESFQIDKDTLTLNARKPAKPLSIGSCNVLANHAEIFIWAQHFDNIDAKQYQNEYDAMLHDEAVGSTPKERKLIVAQTIKVTNLADWTGIAIAAWLLLYPHPYKYAVTVGLVYPILVIGLFYLKRNVATFNSTEDKASVYPSLTTALLATPLCLVIRVIYDWDLLSYSAILLPAFILAVLLCAVIFFILSTANVNSRNNAFTRYRIGIFILLYSYTTTVTINCEFDSAHARVYQTTITYMRYTTGKGAANYITINKCGPLAKPTEVTVSRSFYNQVGLNQTVMLNVQPGLLHIPWFYVSR